MKKNLILIAAVAALLPLPGLAGAAADVAVQQVSKAPAAVNTSVENTGDSAFASDLKAAEDLLRGLSHERKMNPKQSVEYIAGQMARARKFYEFAKSTLIPHSVEMSKMMKNPDEMIAKGKEMTEADRDSWQGYDYLASGTMLKKDYSGAREYFKKARAAAPDSQKDWYSYMLAACDIGLKDQEKALKTYEGIIARNDNWLAVKSSYMGASMLMAGKGDPKAAAYFDKGFSLYSPGEQAMLLKAGICGKFKGLAAGPEACAAK